MFGGMARVLLLFGGRSGEHKVSCVSSVAVYEALGGAGHEVVPVGIDLDGVWHLADPASRPFAATGPEAVFEVPTGTVRADGRTVEFDVVFPVLHGPFGEDGTVQGMFELTGTAYVGCGVLASAMSMDKDVTRRILVGAGIPTPAWEVVRADGFAADPAATVAAVVERLGLPVFVKPAELGSSVGISHAATESELKDGLLEALRYGEKAVVDEFIVGREIEVAVLEGPRTALPGEIVLRSGWYDYRAKYEDETSRFVCPADLTPAAVATVRELAARAFDALECRGLARVDFFYEQDGRGFLLNEVNTMPGFTPISGFPAMWQASGMTYPELCNELVRLAMAGRTS